MECELIAENRQVLITNTDGSFTLFSGLLKDLKIEPRLGNVSQKIELPDRRVFSTDDHDAVQELKPGGFWNAVARTEKTGWHLIPLAIATPFLAFGLYRLMIPVLIYMAMAVTPDGLLYSIDNNTIKTMDTFILEESSISEQRQNEITEIFDTLIETKDTKLGAESERNFQYKLLFRDANYIGPNAFALPGGTIVITDDLIELFDENYVLAAVLAHEIGHVDNEHQLRQLYRALGMAALISVIAGDAGEILEDALLEGSALLSLSYSRKHETQSDSYSYELLKASDMRTDGLITFFDRLEKDFPMAKKGEWVMSHPISDSRKDAIRALIEADGGASPE